MYSCLDGSQESKFVFSMKLLPKTCILIVPIGFRSVMEKNLNLFLHETSKTRNPGKTDFEFHKKMSPKILRCIKSSKENELVFYRIFFEFAKIS